jgi:hypothetical protein
MNNTLTHEELEDGYKLLFDGKTLEGWNCTGLEGGWGVEDECIVCLVNQGRFLFTEERFENFVLSIDFLTEPDVNSGIFLRVHDLSRIIHNGIEMQILDTYHEKVLNKFSCGAIYDMLEPSSNAVKPAGEWNTAVIECSGPLIRITLNGQQIIDMNLDLWDTPGKNPDGTSHKFQRAYKSLPRLGRIALQDHGGKIWFRNIKLREL